MMSLLQPNLLNSLPLTSYALLLDAITKQNYPPVSSNTNLLAQLNQQVRVL